MTHADFHNELRLILTSYYEGIVKMVGASGVSQKLANKCPIQLVKDTNGEPPAPPAAGSRRRPSPQIS